VGARDASNSERVLQAGIGGSENRLTSLLVGSGVQGSFDGRSVFAGDAARRLQLATLNGAA